MDKIKEMVDVETIIGNPIVTQDGTTIIPISKVSYGFASAGSDLPANISKELFGGGSGGGVSIQPVAFIVVANGDVKLLQMSMNANSSNAVINLIPEVFDKISSLLKKDKKDEAAQEIIDVGTDKNSDLSD